MPSSFPFQSKNETETPFANSVLRAGRLTYPSRD